MNAVLCLWLQEGYAKFPTTLRELRVIVVLVVIGFLLATGLIRPLLQAVQSLEQQKRPRGERGRRFTEQTAAPHPLALRGCDLRGADLASAFLVGTDFSDTDLRGAALSEADLENVCLRGAIYDHTTCWPSGFDPARHGAVRMAPPP